MVGVGGGLRWIGRFLIVVCLERWLWIMRKGSFEGGVGLDILSG